MSLLPLFPLIILLPVYQITRKSRDKELQIEANIKSRGALEGTFSIILLFHKKSLASLKLYYSRTCR